MSIIFIKNKSYYIVKKNIQFLKDVGNGEKFVIFDPIKGVLNRSKPKDTL